MSTAPAHCQASRTDLSCFYSGPSWHQTTEVRRQQLDKQRRQRHERPLEQDQQGLHRQDLRGPGRPQEPEVQPDPD